MHERKANLFGILANLFYMDAACQVNAGTCPEILLTADGMWVGISSGAALWAATRLVECPELAGKNIATIFPDGGERYLSTALLVD